MINNEEKINQFMQAITAHAEGQRDRIRRETELRKGELIFKAEQEALTEVYRLVRKETAKLRSEGVREIARHEQQARQAVLARRTQIFDEIADQARQRLQAFTQDEAYPSLLVQLMTQAATVLPPQDTVYYIAAQDAAHRNTLAAVCPLGSRVELTNDIVLGGVRGEHLSSGLIVDNTLDSRLQQQLEWFTETSGLTLE